MVFAEGRLQLVCTIKAVGVGGLLVRQLTLVKAVVQVKLQKMCLYVIVKGKLCVGKTSMNKDCHIGVK